MMMLSGLAGCSDGDDPRADPTPSTSSPSETGSSPTDEPTEPAVQPATGPEIRDQVATLRAPEKWVTDGAPLGADAGREPRGGAALERDVFGLIELDVDEVDRPLTFEAAAREVASYATTGGERVEDRELGGEPAFAFTKSSAFGDTVYTIGLARGTTIVTLDFSLLGAEKRDRLDLVESVLASWEWKQ